MLKYGKWRRVAMCSGKKKKKRRENTGYGFSREREKYGVSYLDNQMTIYNKEQYFK